MSTSLTQIYPFIFHQMSGEKSHGVVVVVVVITDFLSFRCIFTRTLRHSIATLAPVYSITSLQPSLLTIISASELRLSWTTKKILQTANSNFLVNLLNSSIARMSRQQSKSSKRIRYFSEMSILRVPLPRTSNCLSPVRGDRFHLLNSPPIPND